MTDLVANESPTTPDTSASWIDVCATDSVIPDRGVAALIDGTPIAIFRLAAIDGADEAWFAVGHIDPRTGAPVIARGLVGSIEHDGETVPTVASPLHKQRYDLRTGRGIDGEATCLGRWDVAVFDGRVLVSDPARTASSES